MGSGRSNLGLGLPEDSQEDCCADAVVLIAPSVAVQESPRLRRMSTSGTQIFTPGPDGLEIDGLPAGPGKETWSGTGRKREPSFL